ncbi:MAG: hypothetical protein ABSC64_19090 [Candidatus Korobacteraceae bacterium]|jgi:hypothetical protein
MSTPSQFLLQPGHINNLISSRFGPIMDSAFLKLLNEEQLQQITLTAVRAELATAREYTKALEEVLKTVESVKFQGGKVSTKG